MWCEPLQIIIPPTFYIKLCTICKPTPTTYTRKIWVKMLAVKGAVNDLKCCFVFGCLIVRLQQKVAFSPTTFGLCSQSPACFCQPTNEFIFILIEHLSYEFKSGLYPTILWALSRHYAQCNWIMVAPVKMHQTCMNTTGWVKKNWDLKNFKFRLRAIKMHQIKFLPYAYFFSTSGHLV